MEKTLLPKRSYLIFAIAFVAAFAGLLFGYDTGVMSGAILFISEQYHLSAEMNGLVVSSVLFGAVLGSFISGRVTDMFGRKRLLTLVAVIFIIASVLTALATNITLLILGRLAIGVAIGIASYAAPLYISEIAPSSYRGAMVSLNQLAITVGILISYIVDYMFSHNTLNGWRYMFGFGIFPAVLLLCGMFVLPYSPRWLVARGRVEHALRILRRIRGDQADLAEQELRAIQANLGAAQYRDWRLLFTPFVRPALVVACSLAIIQQFVGINTILYYAPTIFTLGDPSTGAAQALISTLPVGIILVIFTLIGLPLIDLWGRRPLLLMGLIGMALGLLLLIVAFHLNANHLLMMLGMLVYIACFAFSLGPIMWLMIAEVFPLSVRGLGSSLATSVNWTANMVVTFTFLSLTKHLGVTGTFFLYFVLCVISLVFVYFFIPETKGVSLEQIEANLYSGKSARHMGAE